MIFSWSPEKWVRVMATQRKYRKLFQIKWENSSRVTLLRVRATTLRDELGRTRESPKHRWQILEAVSVVQGLEHSATPHLWPPRRSDLNAVYHLMLLLFSRSVMSDSLQPHGLQPTRLLCPQDFPDKNTGEGCHFLLQGIFLTQDQTCISCIGRQVLYHWATWEGVAECLLWARSTINDQSLLCQLDRWG